jgi:hypothetical protein
MAEENTAASIIEHTVKAATIVYGFLVFCGALYFHFFYQTFHINIFRYLDLSEMAVSFLHVIIPNIILIGSFFCVVLVVKILILFRPTKKSKMPEGNKIEEQLERKKSINRIQKIWSFISLLICTYYLYRSNLRLSVTYDPPPYRDLVLIVFLAISILITIADYDFKIIAINAMTTLIYISIYSSVTDVKNVIDNAKNSTYTIITVDHDTIITNSKYYFVGRTNKYVFLYNTADSTNDDIPVSEIKRISYR